MYERSLKFLCRCKICVRYTHTFPCSCNPTGRGTLEVSRPPSRRMCPKGRPLFVLKLRLLSHPHSCPSLSPHPPRSGPQPPNKGGWVLINASGTKCLRPKTSEVPTWPRPPCDREWSCKRARDQGFYDPAHSMACLPRARDLILAYPIIFLI